MKDNKVNGKKDKNLSSEPQKSSVALREEAILKFWEENKIFEKSVDQRPKSKEFIFYEGPPTANGKPGIHHVLARSFKDVICRYKTMRGYRVERKAGWDTHGLPVELQVEKELKISSKPEIEKYGIEKFNKKCKASVWEYKDDWEKLTKRIAFWLDLEHPYITYSNEYIESVWWILSEIYKKSLLYEGHKVVPYCSRCGTGLSSHEVAQGYKKIKDISVYLKFKIKPGQKIGDFTTDDNTYFLVWTTTPWTLPGNVALAVGKDIIYCHIKIINSKNNRLKNGENYIFSKKYFDQSIPVSQEESIEGSIQRKYDLVMNDFNRTKVQVIKELIGKDLLNLEYEQLFDFVKPSKPAFKVVAGDFVTTQDGSGIVHIAPAFGEDDMQVAKENDLPVLMTVNLQGKFIPEITSWAGKYVAREETNKEIISELEKRGVLFKTEEIEHDYPFCWRCGTKLIYYAKKSWFIKMTDEKIKKALIKNNEKINWIPEYIKEGRMGEWLREIKDWALSRERYWGTPLPIWRCQKCAQVKIIGSIAELEKLGGKKIDDLHRPYIDEIAFKCDKCAHSTDSTGSPQASSGRGGIMKRVIDVIDCWFDSGSMPFSQWHYPFENKELIDPSTGSGQVAGKKFPADYISEAIDQTRGWFYTLLAISTLLGKGAPYKNVITYGHILDAKGQKMSKSKGNVVDPWEVADKYGIDVLRWYFYTVGGPGEPKRFDFKDLAETQNKFFRAYWNSYLFFVTYGKGKNLPAKPKALNLLDRWIISRLNETILEATKLLDDYDVIRSARLIGSFVDELSNWYIRRSRDRMRMDDSAAVGTLSLALSELTKLTAPFAPFISEEIYRDVKINDCPESVHLADWPKADKELIDEKLNEQMQLVRQIVTLGLAGRAKAKIKVRQPLAALQVQGVKEKIKVDLLELIKDELNVKKVLFVPKIKESAGWVPETDGKIIVAMDTKITPELKEEGVARDIARHIQEMRKDVGLTKENTIEIFHEAKGIVAEIFARTEWRKYIKEKTIAKSTGEIKGGEKYDMEKNLNIEGENFKLAIIKIK